MGTNWFRPISLEEALELRMTYPDAYLLCGATHLMTQPRTSLSQYTRFIDLSCVEQLYGCHTEERVIQVGAAFSYARAADFLASTVPALAQACRSVGTPQVRNKGTLGGAVALSLPNADLPPALLAVGAEVVLTSIVGSRVLPIEAWVCEPPQTSLQPDEIITALRFPRDQGPQAYHRLGRRAAFCFPEVAAAIAIDAALPSPYVRIAMTVGTGAFRLLHAEQFATEALSMMGTEPPEEIGMEFYGIVEETLAAHSAEIPEVVRTSAAAVAVRTLQEVWSDGDHL